MEFNCEKSFHFMFLITVVTITAHLGRESEFFLTLMQGKEPPSQPSYDPGETQHLCSLLWISHFMHYFFYTNVMKGAFS